MNLPKNWLEISYFQYTELLDIEINDYENKILEQLAVLLDASVDDEIIDSLDFEEVLDIFSKLKWLKSPIPKKVEKIYKNKKLKDFNDLTLGEFIDIEFYLSEDFIKNKPIVAAILYRNSKVDEWGNTIFEPYLFDPIQRSQDYNSMCVCSIEGLIDSYQKFKDIFMKNYEQLFEKSDEDDSSDDVTGVEARELKKLVAENKKRKKWGYENLIWNLSNGDITKFNGIFDMKLILVFNILSMRKSLGVE